jgi:hypothetical protein
LAAETMTLPDKTWGHAQSTGRVGVGTALFVILAGALALFLVTPLDGLNLHPAAIALQHQTEEAIILLSPYFLVALAGATGGSRHQRVEAESALCPAWGASRRRANWRRKSKSSRVVSNLPAQG